MDASSAPRRPTRPRPLRDAALAFTLLTALPLRVEWPAAEERPDIAGWFPLVGAVLGLLATAIVFLAGLVVGLAGPTAAASYTFGPVAWPLAVIVVGTWALATRMLHWDGLADTADGLGGASKPAARRAIMADSATGAFGATAVAFVALAQVASVATILGTSAVTLTVKVAVLVAVPVLGRLAATMACWFGTPANPGGLGASVVGRPRVAGALATVVVLATSAVMLHADAGTLGVGWLAAGILIAGAIPHVLAGRVGGVTGDVMGASVLLTEASLLLLATLVVIA